MNKNIKRLIKEYMYYSPKHRRLLKLLKQWQYYKGDELDNLQNTRLQRMIHHCYNNVPYYKDLFREIKLKPEDIVSKCDLNKLPFLDKQTVKNNFDKLIAKRGTGFFKLVETTSGTTGIPSKIVRDYNSAVFESAVLWRFWQNAGDYRGRRLVLRGGIVIPATRTEPPFWVYNGINRELVLSSSHLYDENFPVFAERITKFNPEILYAYPSTAYLLARFFISSGNRIKLKAVFTSSETLLDIQRDIIREAFQCEVFDWYGQSERIAAIGQCENGTYHIIEDYSVTELVDTGESMEIVGTGLENYTMPLLRYRTGDFVEAGGGPCPCGREFRTVKKVLGRKSHFILYPNGKRISATVLGYYTRIVPNINETQFVQNREGELIINIVVNDMFRQDDILKIADITEKNVGSDIKITVNVVKSIPRGPNGKFNYFIGNLPGSAM